MTKELFHELKKDLQIYLPDEQVHQVEEAFLLAEEAHSSQTRKSGEPYITHPVAVARILASLRMDSETIMAALMHDVLEDTPVKKEVLIDNFGKQVAELVDGVSKLTKIKFKSQAQAQADNFRKMVLAMVLDIRVILVKLADRLHNIRTLGSLPMAKRHRIARETLDIYAPIANRLGIYAMRAEIEDLAFAALYPLRSRVIRSIVEKAEIEHQATAIRVQETICQRFEETGMPPSVIRLIKQPIYSIYRLMQTQHLSLHELADSFHFRILVDKVEDCYRILGVMHNLYKPVPDRFSDYIAIPKLNGYQALHTTLFGPYGIQINTQILTHEMNLKDEYGVTAHWRFQNDEGGLSPARERAQEWLRQLKEMQSSAGNSLEFIEDVKIDLFADEIYVFTPKGTIIELPKNATAVDFAYAVHSEMGNSCVAVKIDRRQAPLSTPLTSGQTVEVISMPSARPNPGWLNFVVTGKARNNIRHFLKSQQRNESISIGKKLLAKSLELYSLSLATVPNKNITSLLNDLQLESMDDLFEAIGLGNQMPQVIAGRLASHDVSPAPREEIKKDSPALMIAGSEGMLLHFASCCKPIPGDPIIGRLVKGHGLEIHHDQCEKIASLRHTQQAVNVRWEDHVEGEFETELRIEVINQRGVLAVLTQAAADSEANINDIRVNERGTRYAIITMIILIRDRIHLARVLRRLHALKIVTKVFRVGNKK